jgi:phosphonate transport system ATP-binding protein
VSLALDGVGLVHPNGQRALRGVSFTLQAGERVAVIGPSGAGKTTLLRLLAASLRPTEGRVSVLGLSPWQLRAGELKRLRARIGLVHQAAPIPPRQRVISAVLAGRLGRWPAWKALASLVYPLDIDGPHAALARLDLADRLFDRCDRLSGGQLQRVGIARVLYQAPDLLLADEPAAALDPALSEVAVSQLVAQSRDSGATLVASLHAVDLALEWFARIVALRGGELVFDRPASEVTPEMLQALYAGEGAQPPVQRPNATVPKPMPLPAPGCR